MTKRHMSAAEVAIADATLPSALTEDMRDLGICMFEALVLSDDRAGQKAVAGAWQEQLQTWANQVRAQLLHLADQKGGHTFYLARGVSALANERDREMFQRSQAGWDYERLAKEYDLTPMRVRQVINALERERFLTRQSSLFSADPA